MASVRLKIGKRRSIPNRKAAASGAGSGESHDGYSGAALALIAHELNNIAVPLRGFTDHALQHTADDRVVRECVHEFQLGVGRIRALASDLESLGENASVFEVTTLGDCVNRALSDLQGVFPPIEWCCPRDIHVRVDSLHARRAIVSLIRVSLANDSTRYPAAVTIAQKASNARHCVVCNASLRRQGRWVFLCTSAIRRVSPEIFRDPFGADVGGRTSRRLALAVLDRCAHHAGGHVSVDGRGELLTLAIPIAD